MRGYRVTGKRAAKLTSSLAKKLNEAGKKGIDPVALCKFLKVPAVFSENNTKVNLNCSTKEMSGHISKISEFLHGE